MMNKRVTFTLLILLFGMVQTAAADPIPPERLIDWSNAGIPSGIPDVPQGADVTDFGAVPDDGADDTAAFQAAIDAVQGTAANAIFIPAGTYDIGNQLTIGDSAVLRGEDPTLTHLKLGSAGPNIDIVTYQRGDWVDVVSGTDKESTSVTVSSASGFTVGSFFEIQQENDPAEMYTDSNWIQSWAENAVGQIGVVTAINGNTLTLREPLNIDYDPAFTIQIRDQGLVEYVGIENLHLDRSDLGSASSATVQWKNAAYVWMDRVHSEWTDEKHITTNTTYRCEVRDSLFHESYDYGGGGHGYGVEFGLHTTGCLVENNIFHTLRHAMMVHLGANGNVFGYNYSETPESGEDWIPPDISIHGHYPFANLFEGNIVFEVGIGDYWGPSGVDNTFHRNCVDGDGLWYADASHDQNITGNTVLSGEFGQRSGETMSVTGVIMHGNYWNGAVQWDSTIAEQEIVDSYYLTAAPPFYSTLPWPSIGADMPTECTNPAAVRWQANAPFDPPIIVTPTPSPTPDPNMTPTHTPEPTATPLPTATPSVEYGESVFVDAVGSDWRENSWGGTHTEVSDPISGVGGDQVWEVTLADTWSALRFENQSGAVFNFNDFDQICFDMYYPAAEPIVILRSQFDGTYAADFYEVEPQGAGAWHTYCYDLAGWQPTNFTQFDAIRIQDQGVGNQETFYIDNVVLANASTSPVTLTPMPTDTPPVATETSTPTDTPPVATETPIPATATPAVPLSITLDNANTGKKPVYGLLLISLIGVLATRFILVSMRR